MAIHLTRIYTKTGDQGTTALGDMSRVPKTDPRIAAYADVDEANCAIGVAVALGGVNEDLKKILTQVQNDLFDVGADLCNPVTANPSHPPLRVSEGSVQQLETWCDVFNAPLSTLDSFILPGGTQAAALLHQARAITRRAERSTWALLATEPERTHSTPVVYLNRLSDLLFILARVANPDGDVLWKPGAGSH